MTRPAPVMDRRVPACLHGIRVRRIEMNSKHAARLARSRPSIPFRDRPCTITVTGDHKEDE